MPLIPLTAEHLELILPWRNAPTVRRAMYNQHEISLEEHFAWFERLKVDQTRQWYLFQDEAGEPQGVVYFTDINQDQQTAFWGFYARPEAASGTGMNILMEALDFAFESMVLHKVNAEVLNDNPRSVYLHNKVGFIEEGRFREQHLVGNERIDIIRLGLLGSEWLAHREKLERGISQLIEIKDKSTPPLRKCEILMLSDRESWINEHLLDLQMEWEAQGHQVTWAHSTEDAFRFYLNAGGEKGAAPSLRLCFCLSFGEVVNAEFRSQFDHTLVVHESDLPKGKGWSPLTWQILEGKKNIPATLIEAEDRVDSGVIYAQRWLDFQGHELIDELREGQAHATHELCRWFVDHYPESIAERRDQKGEESFYVRRGPKDSQLDPNKTLAEQFDLLRVVDNERYPAFFKHRGQQYRLSVTKQ